MSQEPKNLCFLCEDKEPVIDVRIWLCEMSLCYECIQQIDWIKKNDIDKDDKIENK
jgi:hypothetical protein